MLFYFDMTFYFYFAFSCSENIPSPPELMFTLVGNLLNSTVLQLYLFTISNRVHNGSAWKCLCRCGYSQDTFFKAHIWTRCFLIIIKTRLENNEQYWLILGELFLLLNLKHEDFRTADSIARSLFNLNNPSLSLIVSSSLGTSPLVQQFARYNSFSYMEEKSCDHLVFAYSDGFMTSSL